MHRTPLQQLSDDQGFVLPIVIGAIALVTVFAVGGFAIASQTVDKTTIMETEDRAFQVASSGLDREIADFRLTDLQGNMGIVHEATLGDGRYIATIQPLGGYRYSVVCTGTVGDQVARVRTDFFYLDMWGINIATGDAGRTPGSAGEWNGGATIDGPFYVANGDFNSNLDFIGGPFFSGSDLVFKGGVSFTPDTVGGKYTLYANGTCNRTTGGNLVVVKGGPKIADDDIPWIDDAYKSKMEEKAKAQSKDNKLGDGNPLKTIAEVSTLNNENTYLGTKKAPGATAHYKVITPPVNGTLTIGATTVAANEDFGQVTKTMNPVTGKLDVTGSDDFAFDVATGILCVEGVVYVKGNVTIGPNVREYRGSGVIVSDGLITVSTGSWGTNGTFQPQNGNASTATRAGAIDLTGQQCLGLVGVNGVTIANGSGFEGVIFTNGTLDLQAKTRFEGAVHARAITARPPSVELFMENFEGRGITITSVLPDGIPGSSSDPRPGGASHAALFSPGTWSRVQ
jgi:hypothetical protein